MLLPVLRLVSYERRWFEEHVLPLGSPVTTGPSQRALRIVQETGNLNTGDPNRLSIEVTERILEYAPEVYARWRDPAW